MAGEMLREKIKYDWDLMRAMSRSALVVRVALIGAASAPIAWAMVLVAHWVFGGDGPSVTALLLAIPRGALYGVILALILHAYWKRHPRKDDLAS